MFGIQYSLLVAAAGLELVHVACSVAVCGLLVECTSAVVCGVSCGCTVRTPAGNNTLVTLIASLPEVKRGRLQCLCEEHRLLLSCSISSSVIRLLMTLLWHSQPDTSAYTQHRLTIQLNNTVIGNVAIADNV